MKRGLSKFVNALRNHWLFVLILIIILGWILYSYLTEGIIYLLATSDINSIVDFINSFGLLAVIIFILLIVLEVVFAPIPPFVLYVAGGMIFGAFLGGTITLFGNVLGAVIAFLIARKFGRGFVEKKVSKKLKENFDKFTNKYGAWALFLIRLNPFTTSDIFSYLSGLTKMKLRTLIISTTFGLIPLVYLQTYLGDVFIRDNPFLFFLFIAVSLIYLVLFLYGLWYLIIKKEKIKPKR